MWELFISSESENSRFGEFGGDFGEGGALVLPLVRMRFIPSLVYGDRYSISFILTKP